MKEILHKKANKNLLEQFIKKEDKIKSFLDDKYPLMHENDKKIWIDGLLSKNTVVQKYHVVSYEIMSGIKLWEVFNFLPNIEKHPPNYRCRN